MQLTGNTQAVRVVSVAHLELTNEKPAGRQGFVIRPNPTHKSKLKN